MPHAERLTQDELEREEKEEARVLSHLINNDNPDYSLDLNRELDVGEKHADAIDYEDIGDDDLPEEEEVEATPGPSTIRNNASFESTDLNTTAQGDGVPGTDDAVTDDIEDLFEEFPSAPVESGQDAPSQDRKTGNMSVEFEDDGDLFGDSMADVRHAPLSSPTSPKQVKINPLLNTEPKDETASKPVVQSQDELEQERLFALSRGGIDYLKYMVEPSESAKDLIKRLYPSFQLHKIPRFTELLPSKRSRYIGKVPLKIPKPVQATRINLEFAVDQEKSFKVSTGGHKRTYEDAERQGIEVIRNSSDACRDDEEEAEEESDYENEPVGGLSWQDFQVACDNWDVHSTDSTPQELVFGTAEDDDDDLFQDLEVDWDGEFGRPSPKRRKIDRVEASVLATPRLVFPSWQDPERATAKVAKRVVLDLNDPLLLIDEDRAAIEREASKLAGGSDFQENGKTLSKNMSARYNISNDDAYDLLKENHKSKSRNTLGNLTVNHSMPALRLQWPYYKTRLGKQDARSFHRPTTIYAKGEPIVFQKPRFVKKKHLKGKDVQTIFASTKDLSLNDNSHVLLLEYSEEYPSMMSNFGMNSRIINYYRQKDEQDSTRPKLDIGELAVLQAQDTSPLTLFGSIDPGETTPAIYNGMYKAPIFEQRAKPTDFLLVRNSTGVDGAEWYMRNIEYVRVVGQQFPSIDVPGPNSRKVTTASKNRLKMVSYRLIRRKKPQRITIGEVTPHILDPNGEQSTETQNRQKMKEFMRFNKECKEWEMPEGSSLPDRDQIRRLVTPEDVCLLEAMQVGQQQLEDAGFTKETGESEDDDAEKENQSLEQQLTPWQTSKNFLLAANSKAMLQLYGEGDPSTRGEAFSLLKTSMKGGFKAIGESVEDKIDARRQKDIGGHSYNVARQQALYDLAIREIWNKQKQSLSSVVEPDVEKDVDEEEEQDDALAHGRTPRSEMPTLSGFTRRDNDTMSQLSRFSGDSQGGKVLKITRRYTDVHGSESVEEEIVHDWRVARQYIKLRKAREAQKFDLGNLTHAQIEENPELKKAAKAELERLERNKDRRIGREKQKASQAATSPDSLGSTAGSKAKAGGGTARKCANCGMVGHIKTNKKLCPMLNGTMKADEGFSEPTFAMSSAAL